jgi:hypothetical protein
VHICITQLAAIKLRKTITIRYPQHSSLASCALRSWACIVTAALLSAVCRIRPKLTPPSGGLMVQSRLLFRGKYTNHKSKPGVAHHHQIGKHINKAASTACYQLLTTMQHLPAKNMKSLLIWPAAASHNSVPAAADLAKSSCCAADILPNSSNTTGISANSTTYHSPVHVTLSNTLHHQQWGSANVCSSAHLLVEHLLDAEHQVISTRVSKTEGESDTGQARSRQRLIQGPIG